MFMKELLSLINSTSSAVRHSTLLYLGVTLLAMRELSQRQDFTPRRIARGDRGSNPGSQPQVLFGP